MIVVAASAFVAGRLLNRQANPLGLLPFGSAGSASTPIGMIPALELPVDRPQAVGSAGNASTSISMIPAPELPTDRPQAVGDFVERKDNTITIQPISIEMNSKGAGVIRVLQVDTTGDGTMIVSPSGQEGPQVEVVVTNQTLIYRDVTEMSAEQSKNSGATPVQQVVEIGSLDDLKSRTMIDVMVWGRKNGDRIIADVISYSIPVLIKK